MKTEAPLLQHFIQDFNLENEDHSVCFTANIVFVTNEICKQMDSEVHLVTSKETGLSVLYLLDIDVREHDMPDTIPYNKENFFYNKKQFLSIREVSREYGTYKILIYPIERKSYPELLNLWHANTNTKIKDTPGSNYRS